MERFSFVLKLSNMNQRPLSRPCPFASYYLALENAGDCHKTESDKNPLSVSILVQRIYPLFQKDQRLTTRHISLHGSLLLCWIIKGYPEHIAVTRKELMTLSKFSSYGTYHKHIRELAAFGYIHYEPSFDRRKGSLVTLVFPQSAMEPNYSFDDSVHHAPKDHASLPLFFPPPNIEVVYYFLERQSTASAAEMFYKYYEANEWRVQNGAVMKSWQAAARKWMGNA